MAVEGCARGRAVAAAPAPPSEDRCGEGFVRGHAVLNPRKNVCPHCGLTARAMTVEGCRADMRWRIHERTAAYDRGLTALCRVHGREGAGDGV